MKKLPINLKTAPNLPFEGATPRQVRLFAEHAEKKFHDVELDDKKRKESNMDCLGREVFGVVERVLCEEEHESLYLSSLREIDFTSRAPMPMKNAFRWGPPNPQLSPFQVDIEVDSLRTILGLTQLSSKEIGGIGRVQYKDKVFKVSELTVLESKNSAVSVDLEMEELGSILSMKDEPFEFKFLWHSHVDMFAQPSGRDRACYSQWCSTSPFIISMITTKRGEFTLLYFSAKGWVRLCELGVYIDHDIKDLSRKYAKLLPQSEVRSAVEKECKRKVGVLQFMKDVISRL